MDSLLKEPHFLKLLAINKSRINWSRFFNDVKQLFAADFYHFKKLKLSILLKTKPIKLFYQSEMDKMMFL